MNKIYRNVWNVVTQSWVAAPETARSHGKSGVVRCAAAVVALMGSLVFAAPVDVAMQDFNPENCDGIACAQIVQNGGDVRLVGLGTQVVQGKTATAAVKTLAQMYAEGRVTGENMEYANPNNLAASTVSLGSRSKEVIFKDPKTGSNVKFLVFDNSYISYKPAANDYNIFTSDAAAGQQYIDTRIGIVDSTGGTLHVAIGDAGMPTNVKDNTISMVAKDSSLFYADGTGGAQSKIVWESSNFVDMGSTAATALQTAGFYFHDLRDVTLKTGSQFQVRNEADLKAYNDYLISEVVAGRLNTSEYQTEFQKAYVGKTVTINFVTGPSDLDDEVYQQIGTRAVVHAVGTNASGEVAKGARIDANVASDGRIGAAAGVGAVMLADSGAEIVNNGSIGSMRQGGTSQQYAMLARGTDGVLASRATNNGTVNVGFYAGHSDYLDPSNPNPKSIYGSFASGNYGLGTMSGGMARNAEDGIINVLAAASRGFSLNGAGAESSNAGTVNVGVTYIPDGISYLAGSPIYGVWMGSGTSFVNEESGEIYLGRGAQYMPGEVVQDVQNGKTTPLVGIYTNGSAKVTNNGQITLGTQVAASMGIYALNNGAQPVVNSETGVITVKGTSGFENIGVYAENSTKVINAGTIRLEGNNGIGIKAASVGTGTANVTSTGKVEVDGSMDAAGYRNYGMWAEGAKATIGMSGGSVDLIGDRAVGVHARSGAKISIDSGSVAFIDGEDQIGFLAAGAGSTVDIKTAPAGGLEVSTDGSTLFRIEDGAKISNSVGARLIASGKRSTALQVTGVGSAINLDGADITVSGEGATALKLEGGATGQMSGAARLVLKDGSTAVVVDNTKYDLTGKAVGAAQSIFTNNANVEVTNATDVTAFVVRNGGQLINVGDIHLSHGTAIEVVGKGSTVVAGAKAGKITVDDGVAGIHVHGGASLSTADTITVDGGASGILVGADAGKVVVTRNAAITGKGAGYGNLITNHASAATTLVDGATLEMQGSGAALLTENNLDEASHGTIVVSSLRGGKGIALSIEDGGVTNGSLTVGDAWKIDVTGNGAGVYANTTGDLMVNSQSLTLSGDGGNAIRIDAAKQVTVGAGARLSTENANAVLIEGNPQTLRNNGQIAAASASAVAVALDDQGHTFINGGTGKVTGIVSLGNGRNAATLEAGSLLEGTLLGGSGDDNVTVEGDAKFTQVDGGAEGDNLLVFDGAHYTYADADAIHNFDRVQLTGNSTVALERALTVAKDGSDNAAVEIDAGSTLAVVTGEAFVLNNPLSGKGTVSTSTGGQRFDFGAANGTSLGADFSGKLSVGHSTFDLSGTNTRALGSATLEAGQDSLISVGDGTQQIGGLAFAGGTVVFNASIPEQTVASSVIKVDVLDASGEGQIRVTVPAPYVPSVPDTPNTANLLEQDDGMIGVKLVEAQSIIGSGGGLELQDQNGQKISDKREVDISQGSEIVAKGTYDFRLTSAPGDGLYVNYGLTEMDLQAGKTLSLAQDHDKKGAAADMSAKLTGEGNLAIDAGNGTLSVSNTRNDYAGETTVRSGTLRLDADGALGQTSALYISDNATTNLNGRTQTIGLLNSHAGSTLDVNNGTLTIANGGLSAGSLTGAGQINVAGGLLEVQGANADLSSRTNIAQSATVQINDTLGLGTGVIANDGTLDLNGATGALTNVISGRGAVNLISGANVSVTGDNSVFSGQFATAESASLTVAEAKHLGEAKLVNEGQLVVDTATDWILANTVSGSGDLIKQGAGTLTAGDALTYAGKTAINAGAVIVGDVSQPNINLGGVGAGEVAVKQGAILAGQGTVQGEVSNAGTISALNTLLGYETAAASTFTLAGGLINSGIINLAGGQVGNRLLVKSDYVGQNGTVVLNTYMGDDSSATDKLIFDGGAVTGNTNLVFKHAGGDGAQTQQGIRVVETQNGATTTAEAFVLDARSDGYRQGVGTLAHGAYDYTLARGGNGGETEDWYLVSALAPANPPEEQPGPPEEKIAPPAPWQPPSVSEPVYRPEVGGYLANRQAALNMQVHTLRERQAQAPGVGGNGGEPSNNSWFRIAGSQTDWDANGLTGNGTEQVVHFGSDVARFSAGANGKVHLGVMGQYSRHTGSVDNGWLSASHKADGVSGGVYGTWYGHQDELSGPYIDTWLMYGRFNNQVQGQGLSGESYHSQVFTGSVEGGYSFKIDERPGAQVYLQPQVQLIYSDYRADDHKESTGTMISGQSMGTVLARLGVRLQGDFQNEAKQTRMRPFAELNWWYNNRGSQGMNFDAQQVSLDLPSQYGEFKVGLQGNLSKRLEVWGSAGVKTDMSSFTKGSLQGGVKYNW